MTKSIQFYYDFSSPYTYIAHKKIREIQKKNNELFQSGYDFSPKTIKDKIQEGKDYIDDFLNKKFPDRPEMQKYFGKLKFDAYKLNEKF